MSFWAEIGVSKSKEAVIGDDEADVTITRVSLSNASKLKDGSRCKLMALGDGYDDWIAVCTFLVGTEESCPVRLHVAALSVLRLQVVGEGVVDISGFAAIPYDMEDVSDEEDAEGSVDQELQAKLGSDDEEDAKLAALLGGSSDEGEEDEEGEDPEGDSEEDEDEEEEDEEEEEEEEAPVAQKRKAPASQPPAADKKLKGDAGAVPVKKEAPPAKQPPAKAAAAAPGDHIKKAAASGAQFIQSPKFVASIPGYVFKKDKSGLGYYKDVKPAAVQKGGRPSKADAWAEKKLETMKWKDGPQGLKYRDAVVGTGDLIRKGQQAVMHYTGKLQKNGRQFDSSVGKSPFRFGYGRGEVIKGWDLGLEGMKCGGRRVLEIPSALGYGRQGAGKDIPPNSNLTFEVQLLKCGK